MARIQNWYKCLTNFATNFAISCFHFRSTNNADFLMKFLFKISLFTKSEKKEREVRYERGSVSLLLFFCLKIGDNQNTNKRRILLSWLLDLQIFQKPTNSYCLSSELLVAQELVLILVFDPMRLYKNKIRTESAIPRNSKAISKGKLLFHFK